MSWPTPGEHGNEAAMLDLAPLLIGFALPAGLIIAIGSQNAFVLCQGLRGEHVGSVVAFCALADLALIAASVAGLGAVPGRLPGLVTTLALGGAMFLGCYGLTALRRAAQPGELVTHGAGAALTLGAALTQVAAFTLLSPTSTSIPCS